MTEQAIIHELATRTKEALATSASFADAAVHAFRVTSPAKHLELKSFLRWLQTTDGLPPSTQDDNFAQPAITVYRDDVFRIEVLCWTQQMPETCHSHINDGAFCPLSGTRLHMVYELRDARDVTENLTLGTMQMLPLEVLGPGDTRKIIPGLDFIHNEWFIDPVSISLGIRPHRFMQDKHDLLLPGIGWRMEHSSTFLTNKRGQILAAARMQEMAIYHALITEMIEKLDPYSALFILRDAIDSALPEDRLTSLVEAVDRRHACLAGQLEPFVANYRRMQECIRLAQGADFDTRLVLGLISSACPAEEVQTVFSEHRRARDHGAAAHLQRLLAGLASQSRVFAAYVPRTLV